MVTLGESTTNPFEHILSFYIIIIINLVCNMGIYYILLKFDSLSQNAQNNLHRIIYFNLTNDLNSSHKYTEMNDFY